MVLPEAKSKGLWVEQRKPEAELGVHRAGQPLPCVAVGWVVRKLPDQWVLQSRRRRIRTSWKSRQEGPGVEAGGLGQVNKDSRAREQNSQEELCPGLKSRSP